MLGETAQSTMLLYDDTNRYQCSLWPWRVCCFFFFWKGALDLIFLLAPDQQYSWTSEFFRTHLEVVTFELLPTGQTVIRLIKLTFGKATVAAVNWLESWWSPEGFLFHCWEGLSRSFSCTLVHAGVVAVSAGSALSQPQRPCGAHYRIPLRLHSSDNWFSCAVCVWNNSQLLWVKTGAAAVSDFFLPAGLMGLLYLLALLWSANTNPLTDVIYFELHPNCLSSVSLLYFSQSVFLWCWP